MSRKIADAALDLARAEIGLDEASRQIRVLCDDRRVSAVVALQQLLDGRPEGDPIAARAAGYLEAVLDDWRE